ncbi:hypothetical protein ABN702_08405 [Bacillus haimaensis]|uniref:hypothetical protein n=1 Tax=Bacillus haimaensis TaxID=3160967 RepID=UPI003AA88776
MGTSFSMMFDLPAKMTLIAKDIFDYAKDGGKLMIKNGWMEEPLPTIGIEKDVLRNFSGDILLLFKKGTLWI